MFNKELEYKIDDLEKQILNLRKEVKNLSGAIDVLKQNGWISDVLSWDGYKYYSCDHYPLEQDFILLLHYLGLEIKHVPLHYEIAKVNDENSSNGK